MPDPLEIFCDYLAATGYAELPEPVRARARLVTADTLAAIAGGAAEPEIAALTRGFTAGREGRARAIGTDASLDPAGAAFLNATAGTALEMDEGHQYAAGHPAIHALPPALAVAEAEGRSGADLLCALVLGYEAGARIGAGGQLRAGMHPHGTWGAVGAAVAVAKLRGFDAPAMKELVNVVASLGVATSRRTMLEGGTVRNSYAGFAAQAGVIAVDMVRAGFVGERDGLGSVWGHVVSTRWDPQALVDGLGTRHEILRGYFKLHACCRFNHAALDALADLRAATDFEADDVSEVTVETYAYAAELDDAAPRNPLAARFSVPFAIATALVRGGTDVHAFTWDAVRDERIRAMALRVTVRADPALSARLPAQRPARVRVRLRDGRCPEQQADGNRGTNAEPHSPADLATKHRLLCERIWEPRRAAAVLERAARLDTLGQARELLTWDA